MEGLRQISAAWLLVFVAGTTGKEDMKLEASMTPCELIRYHGYPCETSYATTEDGYMLQVVRVAHGMRSHGQSAAGRGSETPRRHPVLFVPPLLETSAVYFINFPSESPGFLFADSGFDVWAMSNRESRPYTNSTRFSQRDPRYWQWSFDELGRYDLAACIDHVLKATGSPKLTTVALSQGVMANLVLHSVRPEYNNKVDLLVAYGPVGNLTHIGPPTSLLIPFVPSLMKIVYPFTDAGYFGTTKALRALISTACTLFGGALCALGFTLNAFCSPEQFNKTRIPVYMGHMPMGTTVQNLLHFHQLYKARNFVMYDHGPYENLRRYGQRTAPPYPLERIRLPVALFWSHGDTLAGATDVSTMAAALGSNVIMNYVVPVPTFRHLDFATGYRANDIVHNVALELIRKRIDQNP